MPYKARLSMHERRQTGFTLIELMIVVAVIGILAAIALPSYQESVKKSRRVELQRTLSDAEQYMRRYYGAKDTFAGATLETKLKTSPSEGTTAYRIELGEDDDAPGPSTFMIKATRTGVMEGDRCGDLTIDQTGKRTQSDNTSPLADCFKGS